MPTTSIMPSTEAVLVQAVAPGARASQDVGPPLRAIHRGLATYGGSCLRGAAVAVMLLLGAWGTPPMAVNTDPRSTLGHIRSVYVMPFASPDGKRTAESIMTQALRSGCKPMASCAWWIGLG